MRAQLLAKFIGIAAAPRTLCIAGLALSTVVAGCDTGFGQPCALPKSEDFRRACNPAPEIDDGVDAGENEPTMESKSSCAIKDYAGCETRICLVYRGSSSFCSETCERNDDCEGEAQCRPLLGDDEPEAVCVPDPMTGAPQAECFCVRKGDLDN